MTSSWALTQRKKMGNVWDIKNFGDSELDSYIINGAHRECAVNWEATPIGNPYGFLFCSKRRRNDGGTLDTPLPKTFDLGDKNGYHKFRADLYAPDDRLPRQLADPYYFYDRTVPNENFLHTNDYLARDVKYDGIGVNPLRTPGPNTPYLEYGFSFSPKEFNEENTPYKFDIQRLQQPYVLWKQEMLNRGVPQQVMDDFSTKYNKSSTMGTW